MTNTSKQTAKPTESQQIVLEIQQLVVATSYKEAARRLKRSYSQIHQISSGKMAPSVKFIKHYRKVTRPRKPQKPRIVITFDNVEDAEYAKGLSMEERREIFRERMEAHNEPKKDRG